VVDHRHAELGRERRDVPPPAVDGVGGAFQDQQRRRVGAAGERVVDPAAVRAGEERHADQASPAG
jgi:hypothetical protein